MAALLLATGADPPEIPQKAPARILYLRTMAQPRTYGCRIGESGGGRCQFHRAGGCRGTARARH